MEIEKKFTREANAATSTTVDLFVDKSTKELKFLDYYKQETILAEKAIYKVVSGYITQEDVVLNGGELIVGHTYFISDYIEGDDFTNVGADLNEAGITFVATGTLPTDWTNSSSLIAAEESLPILTIFENTLGPIAAGWDRGDSYIASNELFTRDKTWKTPDVANGAYLNYHGSSRINIYTTVEGILGRGCSFEIRVYN
jgi:hypothetical protein